MYAGATKLIRNLSVNDILAALAMSVGPGSAIFTKVINGPPCDKICLRGFRQSEIQISLLKGADQTACMRRLFSAFVVCKPSKTGFVASRPKCSVVPRSRILGDTSVPLPEFQRDICKFWGTPNSI